MSNAEISMTYDDAAQRATLTFSNGRQLKIAGVTKEKAEEFRSRHAAEFQKRDCCFTTTESLVTREASHV